MNAPDLWERHQMVRLVELWHAGVSTAKIGREIGKSKNAVIGKANRLNLPSRGNPTLKGKPITERKPKVVVLPKKPEPKPSPVMIEAPKPVFVAPPPVVVEFKPPRPRQCQWLEGDNPPYVQCDGQAQNGSWCPEHRARVFIRRPILADVAD